VTGRAEPVLRVRFYRTSTGARPVREWLLSLAKEVRQEIGADIGRVQWQWPVGRPLVDGFGGGLYEVRTAYDGEQYRVLFYIERDALVLVHAEARGTMVLVHGIHKKTQKTPAAVIALARKRMKEGT
jgi:phage-related protein